MIKHLNGWEISKDLIPSKYVFTRAVIVYTSDWISHTAQKNEVIR